MKRVLSMILCLMMLTCLVQNVGATGNNDFELGQTWDQDILAGGIYDMFVWVGDNSDDYTYQWQVDVSFGDGHWLNLEDNANPYGYRGTQTYHLELITPVSNGYIEGTGWEDIPFCCEVTNKETGVTKYTPNIYMHVYTSDDLPEYMAEKGIELYTPSAGTNTPSTTSDGVTYYTSAEAGQQLSFLCGYQKPENIPLMARSELRADLEIWVTENGKTTKLSSGTYFPYTIGKDKVTAEFRLHYKIGVTDLGYYQIKTLNVSIDEPTVIGVGTAKQEMSLLKESYGQSQKLVTIPKGATVNVYKDSGSWYQVGYGGYVGYVAGSALNYQAGSNIIDHVELTMAEPLAGNKAPTSITVKPDSCFATSVEWYDKTAENYLEYGDRFVKGHDYQLVVWVSAKEGYEFKLDSNDNMLTTAILNGNRPCYTSRAYEQIIGKVIDIRYDYTNVQEDDNTHTCTPVLIPKTEPTCTETGHEAYYHCSCGANYSDPQGNNRVNISTWGVIPAKGHSYTEWRYNIGEHYKYCLTCSEMFFLEDHKGGKATCTEKPICDTCGYAYGMTEPDHKWSPTYLYKEATGHAWICADCKDHSDVIPHTPGPEATEKDPQVCKDCGYIITPAKNHTHVLTKVAQTPATCTQEGNIEYYTCDGCSDRFTDAAGTNQIPDTMSVTVGALGHVVSDDFGMDNDFHWRYCTACSEILAETKMYHEMENGICTTCGYEEGTEPEVQTQPQTEPKDDEESNGSTMPSEENNKKEEVPKENKKVTIGPLAAVLIGLVCFSVAITATIIILKKKGKE